MTNTTYYNLNIVEGTDIVNPLTVDNPNYEKIDEAMHDNAVAGVTLATEIANATVHAITRENSECAVIRFIATSVWKAGDTVTVDGVPVTALLPSGETLPDGAYVINANVLCILTGTNLTVYAERKKIDDASDIKYNDTNVAEAITKLNRNLENCFIISSEYTDTIPSGTTNYYEPILTASIPDGYKLFGITGLRSTSASVHFYSNGRRLSYNQIQIGLQNTNVPDLSGVIYAYRFIFIKENMLSI